MWYILDRNYNTIGILDNNFPEGCPILRDIMKSTLADGAKYLEFDVPSDHEKSSLLTIGNFIVYVDAKRNRELFRITTGIEENGESMTATIKCELAAVGDLFSKVIEDKDFTATSLEDIISFLATDTTWKLGECYYSGSITKSFEDLPRANAAILDAISDFDAEVEFKIDWDNVRPENKFINIKDKIGQKTGVTIQYEQNLEGLTKTTEGNPIVTALVVKCSNKNGNGNAILLKDAKVTPPDGFEIIGNRLVDNDSLEKYGNGIKHIEDSFIDQTSTNPVELYNNALTYLQKVNKPKVTYEASVVMLEQFEGYNHMYVEVGDTVYVKDTSGKEKQFLEARILEKEISQTDNTKGGIVLGEFVVRQVTAIEAVEKSQKKLQLKEKEWSEAYDLAHGVTKELDEVKDNLVYKVDVLSTKGSTFKNGIINTQLFAAVYKGKDDISTTLQETAYNWKKFNADGTQDTTWIGTGIGRLVTITSDEVENRATFQCEITVDGKIVAIDQITIVDLNDAIINGERPENPIKGAMYIDSTVSPPIWYTYNGTTWEKQALSVGDLDPALLNTVDGIVDEVDAIDTRVTTSESSIEQLNTAIISKVETTKFDALKTNVDTNTSTISQQAGQISSKVSKNAVISEINQTAETVTIDVSKIDMKGVATYIPIGSPNMMPARYDSFEQFDLGQIPDDMGYGFSGLSQKAITNLYSLDGGKSFVLETTKDGEGWIYLSPQSYTYNIPLQMNATYIFSFYAYNPSLTTPARIRGGVRMNNNMDTVRAGVKDIKGSDGWVRHETKITVPEGVTACNVILYNYTPNLPVYYDCLQFERVEPDTIKASTFKPISTTVIHGGNILTKTIQADHIKSLKGLNVGNGSFVVDAITEIVSLGSGTNLIAPNIAAGTFTALRGNTIRFGSRDAKIDTTPAGSLDRMRIGVNDDTYIAMDHTPAYTFVMNNLFDVVMKKYSANYGLQLGNAVLKGAKDSATFHLRNQPDSAFGNLTAQDIVTIGNLTSNGVTTLNGNLSLNSNAGMVKLNGNNQAFIEFSYGGVRKGFMGTESATGSNMVIASDSDEIIFKTDVCRVKVDNGTARVDFKNASDSAYIPIYASNITYNSVRERKKNIKTFNGTEYPDGSVKTALQQIKETPIRTYRFVEELNNERKHVGLILDEAPVDVIDIRGEGIDAYAMGTYSWSAIQELSQKLEEKENRINELEARLSRLEQLNS
ncbi:phage tail spike protein [Priestia sp. J2]|uniref:phage tail spike protein n=1 Tax=Priestia sp. J2 TaxID=2886505 RepID=UPI001E44FCA0|nr:phage tail spike protein [Priestia sp. J2]